MVKIAALLPLKYPIKSRRSQRVLGKRVTYVRLDKELLWRLFGKEFNE